MPMDRTGKSWSAWQKFLLPTIHCPLTPTVVSTGLRSLKQRLQHGTRLHAECATAAALDDSSWDANHRAPNPRRAPALKLRQVRLDMSMQQVVSEQLDLHGGGVGVEAGAGMLADPPGGLPLGDERLDAGALVVLPGQCIPVRVHVVGQVDLHRPVEVIPEVELFSALALSRAHGDHPDRKIVFEPPLSTTESDLRHLSGGATIRVSIHDTPSRLERHGPAQVWRHARLGQEEGAALVHRAHDGRAIPGGIDANVQQRRRPDRCAHRVDRGGHERRVVVAEARVARAETRVDAGVRFRDPRENRVVAGASVVVGIGARYGAFHLQPEDRRDRRVDVDMDLLAATKLLGRHQTMRGHQRGQRGEGFIVEPIEVSIHRVDTRQHAAGQQHEDRVRRHRLRCEDALLASHVQIDQQSQLCLHRVLAKRARLQVSEQLAQLAVHTDGAQERAERHQPGDTRQRSIGLAHGDATRVRSSNGLRAPMPISPLATDEISAHLAGARCVLSFGFHQSIRRTHRVFNSSRSTIFLTRSHADRGAAGCESYAEASPLDLGGVHVRLFFTQRVGTAVAALGGGAEDEDGAERFRGIGSSSRYTLEVHDRPLTIGGIGDQLREHPAHVVVYFDPSSAKTHRFARTPSLSVHPLCLPMQFSYDRITKTVRVVPASDGGVFSDHNDLRNRLSHQLTGSFFGVTAELKSEQKDLSKLAEGCSWLVIADRAQEGVLTFGVPRVSLKRSAKRDVAVYAKDVQKFVAEFDRQLRRCNYTPTPKSVEQLIGDLGSLLSDGLLALVSQGAPTALDEKRTQGLVGTLVTSAWYRQKHQRSLVVSIDSPDARRWLELRDDGSRADLFGIVDEDDGSCTLDIIEVKTYSQPEDAYRVSGGEISGDAVDQLLNTCRIVEEIFQLDETGRRLVAPQRREVLRQQLFRECFFEGRSEAEKQLWSKKLNDVFGLDVKVKIRLSLVVVGLTQARGSSERVLKSATRDVRLVELTEEEVRRHVTGGTPPGGTPPSGAPPAQPPTSGGGGSSRGPLLEPLAQAVALQDVHGQDEGDAGATPAGAVSRKKPEPASSGSETAQVASAGSSPLGAEERLLIEKQAADLRRILKDHGVPVQELDPEKAQVGPSVIRYRARLRAGAKLSSLRNRAEDIGRELASRTTPFIDNISGETYVGIDLERPRRQTMPLLPAIAALPAPQGLALPVAVGVSPSGEHVFLDIVQLPHLLVAGSTMSGKTVFLHAILLSLIARLAPEQLELLIIDPKATDFVLYNGLPYLRGGRVFTEAEDAVEQLRQLTDEELRERTRILQQARCPNLSEYNAANPDRALKPIVVVIDEYADLMAVLAKKERQDFEREINRLAQRARSVGIHLVLATQRPTADIVTGLLKANMPCRVSFRLPQRVDSQTILDQTGAENLFGRGDMLLLQNDKLSRLQGFYMSPTEMTAFLADRYPGSGVAPIDAEPEDEELDLSVDDRDNANHKDLIGEVTGLAVGPDREDLLDGDVMTIEVGVKPGDGAEVTGRSGDVLKQSVLAAWRHVQQYASDYGIPEEKLRDHGVSVHLVNISEYREGPSAGMPFVVAMVSALSNRPVRRAVAMSGEVSLKGKVSAVGGVPQKVVAAYKRGRKVVILPKANARDLERVPREILDALDIRLVSTASEALRAALTD